ncbi:MAG: hypothetical protein K9N51_02385 [Candidatus Pacebacteria bacterium]|nr:hypothetical protein [Candidatus Paceibacterota bacterium]
MRIKAIETFYSGRYFRSRLEARWAVFFDAIQTGWEYEQLGFEVGGERYLPDFYIPSWRAHVEIKPKNIPVRDKVRIERLLDVWNGEDKQQDKLWLLCGEPARGQYHLTTNMFGFTGPYVFMKCRYCEGMCIHSEDAYSWIGHHTCPSDKDGILGPDEGLNEEFNAAMSYRFDHIEHKLTGEHRRRVV